MDDGKEEMHVYQTGDAVGDSTLGLSLRARAAAHQHILM